MKSGQSEKNIGIATNHSDNSQLAAALDEAFELGAEAFVNQLASVERPAICTVTNIIRRTLLTFKNLNKTAPPSAY